MIKSWKVQRTTVGIILTLNGEAYNLGTSANAISVDLQHAIGVPQPMNVPIPLNAPKFLNAPGLVWDASQSIGGTSLRGYLTGKFPEMNTKLQAMSGQTGECDIDGKVTIEFVGSINGETFTVYDYKGEREPLHISGHPTLNLKALGIALADVGVVSDAMKGWK